MTASYIPGGPLDMYAVLIPQPVATTAVGPVTNTLQPYNASSGPLAPVLPPLSGTRDNANLAVEKDGTDTSPYAITLTCSGSDTFANGSTTITLLAAGERVHVQAATISGTRVWKIISSGMSRTGADDRYLNPADVGQDGILVIGQSNAAGAGTGYVVGQLDPIDPRIHVWSGAGTYTGQDTIAVEPLSHVDAVIRTSPLGVGPGVPFAREWIRRRPVNRQAMIIAGAFGGTPFEGNDSKGTTRRWKVGATGITLNLYENAISMTQAWLATNPNNRVVAVIWAHGEQDGSNGTSGATYQTDLDALIDGLRTRLSSPSLPFLIAQMTPETIAGGGTVSAINTVQIATQTRKTFAGFAYGPGSGLTDPTNGTLHWSASAQRYFGPALYAAYLRAVAGSSATPPVVNTPNVPTGISATGVTDTTVTVSWTASAVDSTHSAATTYTVQKSTNSGSTWTSAATGVTSTTTTVTGLTASTAYQVRVLAINSGGTSAGSSTASFTTTTSVSNFVQDTFTDTAGTSLPSHTGEVGATWIRSASTTGGAAVITAAGRVRANAAAAATYIASGTPNSADQTASLDFYCASVITGSSFGVYIRGAAQAATSYGGYAVRYVVSSGQWQLVKLVSGTATILGTLTATLTPGATYAIVVSAIGTTITATVDGVSVASVTDSGITAAGQVSLTWTGSTAPTDSTGFHGDNFAVA